MQRLKSFLSCFFKKLFFIVVQVQLSPFSLHHSPYPSHPHSSPLILGCATSNVKITDLAQQAALSVVWSQSCTCPIHSEHFIFITQLGNWVREVLWDMPRSHSYCVAEPGLKNRPIYGIKKRENFWQKCEGKGILVYCLWECKLE